MGIRTFVQRSIPSRTPPSTTHTVRTMNAKCHEMAGRGRAETCVKMACESTPALNAPVAALTM